MFLWFWLLVLLLITGSLSSLHFQLVMFYFSGISLVYSGFLLCAPSVRNMMLRSRSAHQPSATNALDEITRRLQVGDWKLLHILGKNMEPMVFGELVIELANFFAPIIQAFFQAIDIVISRSS